MEAFTSAASAAIDGEGTGRRIGGPAPGSECAAGARRFSTPTVSSLSSEWAAQRPSDHCPYRSPIFRRRNPTHYDLRASVVGEPTEQ